MKASEKTTIKIQVIIQFYQKINANSCLLRNAYFLPSIVIKCHCQVCYWLKKRSFTLLCKSWLVEMCAVRIKNTDHLHSDGLTECLLKKFFSIKDWHRLNGEWPHWVLIYLFVAKYLFMGFVTFHLVFLKYELKAVKYKEINYEDFGLINRASTV